MGDIGQRQGTPGLSRRRALGLGLGALGVGGLAVTVGCGDDGSSSSSSDPGAPEGDAGTAGAGVALALFASPSCGCCGSHAAYLEENGFTVDLQRTDELDAMRADLGVPADITGCHFAQVEGYVVEGHMPIAAIERLLADKPDVDGIALPGMPQGSPGMGDDPDATFDIVAFKDGTVRPFMTA